MKSWICEVLFACKKSMAEPQPFHSSKFLLPCPWKVKDGNARKPLRVSCLWCCLWGSTIIGGCLVLGGSSVTPLSFLFGFLLRFLAYLWSSCLWLLHWLWILRLKTVRVLQESIKKQSVTHFLPFANRLLWGFKYKAEETSAGYLCWNTLMSNWGHI